MEKCLSDSSPKQLKATPSQCLSTDSVLLPDTQNPSAIQWGICSIPGFISGLERIIEATLEVPVKISLTMNRWSTQMMPSLFMAGNKSASTTVFYKISRHHIL